jgi:hypothetical protein
MKYKKKYAVLFASRNNYILFEELFYKKVDVKSVEDVLFLNIDVQSTDEQVKYGKEICKKFNITNIETDRDTLPMQNCVDEAIKFLDNTDTDIDWLIVFQHDAYPVTEDFWKKLDDKLIEHENFKQVVGMFGFNDVDTSNRLGRGNLIKGILEPPYSSWYQNVPDSYLKKDYCVVESTNYIATGININLFKKHIKIDPDFNLNLWGDDVAHQFMFNNICNIGFTDLVVKHHISLKHAAGVPDSQTYNPHYFGDTDPQNHHRFWREKYGWTWGYRNKNLRDELQSVIDTYDNTIQKALFNMNINDGPLQIEDLYES